MSNPFGNVDVQVEVVEEELAPFVIDPDDAEKMGVPGVEASGPDTTGPADLPEQVGVQTSETAVKAMIKTLFLSGYMWHGNGHEHWLDNETIIDEITPSVTKFVNQYPLLAEAVEIGDTNAGPIKLLIALVKNQIMSIRINRAKMKGTHADPALENNQSQSVKSAAGEVNLYDGLPTP